MSTPILPLEPWASGTNENSLPANTNWLRLEAMNREVISAVVTSQPVGADGDVYIIPPGATGAQWSSFDADDITIFYNGTWSAWAPVDGLVVNVSGTLFQFLGSSGWQGVGGGGGVPDGDKGDIVVSGGGATWSIDFAATTFDNDSTLSANSSSRIPTQSAVKGYVDNAIAGLSWKRAVRAATTANGTLATAFANGQTVDGVTLATGDRILIKNQSTAADNGIYVVAASGAPTRSTDADAGAELVNASMFVSEGSTQADTQWVCSTNAPITVGSTALTFVQFTSGGGLVNFTEAANSSSPNATIPVVSLTPNNAATNVDIALVPKGTGAIMLTIPNASTSGGNKRGDYAVDLQVGRTAADQVASGSRSFVTGYANKSAQTCSVVGGSSNSAASGNYSAVFGLSCTVTGSYNLVAGQSITVSGSNVASFGLSHSHTGDAGLSWGRSGSISGSNSAVGGNNGSDRGMSCEVYQASFFSGTNKGDAQLRRATLRIATTNATPAKLTADAAAASATNQLALPNTSAYLVRGDIIARENTTGDTKSWEFRATVKRGANAAATALVGSGVVTVADADSGASAWAIALSADTTNGALSITATGEASKSIKWVARIDSVELIG